MNRKGNIFGIVILIVLLLVIAIIGLFFLKMTTSFTGALLQQKDIQNTPLALATTNKIQGYAPNIVDEFILFMFIGGNIALIISAVKTDFSATTIFVFMLLLLIAILLASGAANIYNGLGQAGGLTDVAGSLSVTSVVFSKYFPLFITVISGIIMLIMFGKSGSEIV